jgi:hypothetical protein
MTEVPDLPLDQIQGRVVALWLGSFYGSSGYVAKKLGQKGLREFQVIGAHQVAATFKKLELRTPGDVALAIATNEKNIFGSVVSLTAGDGWAELRRERCALLAGAKAFTRIGASILTKEHCKKCIEGHWRKVFSDLGMTLETESFDEGCVMKISLR